jgi:iron complex outermembrane receptor protein
LYNSDARVGGAPVTSVAWIAKPSDSVLAGATQATSREKRKWVISAVLLMCMTLSIDALAEETSSGAPDDIGMEELLQGFAPEERDGDVESSVTPQGASDSAASNSADGTLDDAPAALPRDSMSEEQQSTAIDEPSMVSELDTIPVPHREPDPPVAAQEPPERRQLEEIVVTAQKREQVSQDVPMSMSVLSETFIKDQGLTSVQDALLFVPNFKILEFANTVTPQCRGFTVSQGNAAFEPPCGLALDGVAYSRAAYFSSGLFDLKRMEVLRGPQGTTFGKNTTAGVIALYSRDPTDEFTANVDLQYGLSGPDVRRAEVGVGGPLIPDVVNFRVAAAKEDRGGIMENTYHQTDPSAPEDIGSSERTAYRVKLLFPDVLGADIKLLTERTTFTPHGLASKVVDQEDDSALARYIRQYDPNYDFGRNWKGSQFGVGYNETILTRTQVEASAAIGLWSTTLVAATGKLINNYFIDATPWPERWVDNAQTESNPFHTAELRTVSPDFEGLFGLDNLFGWDLGSSSMLVGIFGQKTDLDVTNHVLFRYVPTAGIVGAATGNFIPDKPVVDAAWQLEQQTGSQPSEFLYAVNGQTTQSEAIFAQFTWYMTEKWSLDVAGRLSTEKKTADWDLSFSTPAPLLNPGGNRAYTTDKSRSEDSFQPKVSIGYKLSDEINLFAHWAVAYKGGGFNFAAYTGNPEEDDPTRSEQQRGSLSFDAERGTDWGFDIKATLLDNTLRFNLSLFQLTVDDFQVLTNVPGTEIPTSGVRVPNGYAEVINAAKARAQGVELDLQYLPTDWLTVIGALGINDTEYLSFPLANCSKRETPDPETGRCDHTGWSFANAPKVSGTLSLDSRFPMAGLWDGFGDLMFLIGVTVEYTSSQYTTADDPCCIQEAYVRYRAQTGVANPSQGWSFRVTGANLTNEYIIPNIGDDPALPSVSPAPPRSVFAQFSWNY